MSPSFSSMALSFNGHFTISVAVHFGRNSVTDGFNSSLPRLLLSYLHSTVAMDRVVELVDQLTSFQCVLSNSNDAVALANIQMGWLSSNAFDISLHL